MQTKNTIRDQNIVSVPKIGSPGKCTKANKLSFNTENIPGNLRNIFGGQGGGGLPGPIPSTEVRTPKASFNRGTIKIPPISKCPNICTIYAKMQIMQQINANKNTIRDQNIVSVPKIGSPGKCTKANKLSFNTENPGEPEEHFRRTGGGRPTWTNSFYRSKNP